MEVEAPALPDFARYRVEPGEPFALGEHDPADSGGLAGADDIAREYEPLLDRIADLQDRLYAEEERSLLVVLQGIDAAGKDGTVKHVLRGTNPAGVRVYSFKEPSNDEAAHDFLTGALGAPLQGAPAASERALRQAERAISETLEHHAGVRLRAATPG